MTSIPTVPLRAPGGPVPIPLIGFGTWQSEGDDAYTSVRTALDVGYRHIDTATMYRNEEQVGRALADSGVAREDIFVTTKLPPDLVGRERETLEASLRMLGTDYVDLWLIHWPPNKTASPATWERFIEAQAAGQVRAIGVSNYSVAQIDELTEATGITPAINQIPWSPADYDASLVEALSSREVVVEGYSPFKRTNLEDPALVEIAQRHGVDPTQVVLRWHLQRSFVAIPKSVTPARIERNFDVLGFELSEDELTRLEAMAPQRR
ncbi:aldo/keto reductase [Georgenia faecalis]|uniref:aldo/keto reductase n=1 Tax=Georgenia faecalis TaxID=2483799 RepID=UPI000FD8E541|nr:aldo/keto reductase [Georgenia faecalis]